MKIIILYRFYYNVKTKTNSVNQITLLRKYVTDIKNKNTFLSFVLHINKESI